MECNWDTSFLNTLDRRFKATFINSLSGFKSVVLAGTRDSKGLANLAVFNSFFHIGAHPPLCGLIFRPQTVERHTLDNILDTGFYSINHILPSFLMKAHQTSAKYPADISEFEAVGLTELEEESFYAPYVKESKIRLGMAFREKHDLKINGTVLIIGEIMSVSFPENCLCSDGLLDIEKAGTITCSGLDSYHTTQRLQRLSHATTENLPIEIPICYQQFIKK